MRAKIGWREWLMALPTPLMVLIVVAAVSRLTYVYWPYSRANDVLGWVLLLVALATPVVSIVLTAVLGRRLAKVVPGFPCTACGYDMSSRQTPAGARCPECGQFTVTVVRTYGDEHIALKLVAATTLFVNLLALAAIVFGVVMTAIFLR